MQKSFYCIVIIIFALLSCADKKEELKALLEVSPETLTFGPDAGTKTVNVNASGEFIATVSSGSAWCTVATPVSDRLNIRVSANSGAERNAVVLILSEELERTVAVKQLAMESQSPVIELKLPAGNAAFDLQKVSAVIFQWSITGAVPGGCKVLISPSADMSSAVAFFPATAQASALAVTAIELDDMLAGWNITLGAETVVYWTVAAQAQQERVEAKPQSQALRLKRMPMNYAVRAMSYNIRNAEGLDNNVDYQRIADIIKNVAPDVAALQELDSVTNRSGKVDVLARLAGLTGMYSTFGASIVLSGGKYGVGVLSKERPLSWKRVPLPGSEELRSLLIVEFEKYIFCCTHFSLTAADRQTSVGIIKQAVQGFNKPVLLAGDLNDWPESSVLNTFKQDWAVLSNPAQFTFPANNPTETIDYILGYVSNGYKYPVIQAQVLNEPVASDHRPLFADIRIMVSD
jgi:endonuclease/exonuclease/phosphatase family metal-dependent hydrolase